MCIIWYSIQRYLLPPQCVLPGSVYPASMVCITWQWHLPPPWCIFPGSDISRLHGVYYLAVTSPASTGVHYLAVTSPASTVCITWQCISCLHRCALPGIVFSEKFRLHGVYYMVQYSVISPASTPCITWYSIQWYTLPPRCVLYGTVFRCITRCITWYSIQWYTLPARCVLPGIGFALLSSLVTNWPFTRV